MQELNNFDKKFDIHHIQTLFDLHYYESNNASFL